MRVGDAVDIDDEAVGIGKKESGILLEVADVEDDAGELGRDLRGTDAGEEAAIVDRESFAGEFRREARVVEIEVNAVGIFYAGGFKLDLIAEVNSDASVRGSRPVADAGDERARS